MPELKLLNAYDCDPDFRRDPKTNLFCWRCQRDLKPEQPKRWIHLINDFSQIVHPDSEAEYVADDNAYPSRTTGKKDDCGFFPVGLDCAKIIGLEWTHERDRQ